MPPSLLQRVTGKVKAIAIFAQLIFKLPPPHPQCAPHPSCPKPSQGVEVVWKGLDLLINLNSHIRLQGALLLIKTAILLVPRRRLLLSE